MPHLAGTRPIVARLRRHSGGTASLLAALLLTSACSPAGHEGPKTAHFDGRTFTGPGGAPKNDLFDYLWMNITKPSDSVGAWPEHVVNQFDDVPPARIDGDALRVTYVGHATFLIQTQGLNILTDPIYSERASLVSWAGPKRVAAPGVRWENLPPIDLVLVSHGHFDHLDQATLARLWARFKPRIIAPLGHTQTIQDGDTNLRVEEVDWGQPIQAGALQITLEPMQHWSARGAFDRNRALWGAYAIEGQGGPVYFLADSGYEAGFVKAAREKYGTPRLALIPIGAYLPRDFMAYAHMDPAEAVRVHQELGGPATLAHQHEVFDMADEAYDQPRSDLATAATAAGLPADRFVAPKVGQSFTFPPRD